MVPTDLPIRCSCGTLRGLARRVSPSRGNRVICYCADCQSFAHFLARANEILDRRGGTDIFQTSPARVAFTHGRERLACMRLTPKGLLRWYASCCKTPVGNTAITREIPFVGLLCFGFDAASRDAAIGPVRGHVNVKAAKLDAEGRRLRASGELRSIARFARLVLLARLRGDQKASPFFDAGTGEPSVTPRVLAEEELREIVRRRDAF